MITKSIAQNLFWCSIKCHRNECLYVIPSFLQCNTDVTVLFLRLGLDMTARDWHNEAKKKGHPWSLAKGFDTSCPVSSFVEKDKVCLGIIHLLMIIISF